MHDERELNVEIRAPRMENPQGRLSLRRCTRQTRQEPVLFGTDLGVARR
jgi:hypothetical protein